MDQVIADYSNMDEAYVANVAYLLSHFELTTAQTAQLEVAGVDLEGE